MVAVAVLIVFDAVVVVAVVDVVVVVAVIAIDAVTLITAAAAVVVLLKQHGKWKTGNVAVAAKVCTKLDSCQGSPEQSKPFKSAFASSRFPCFCRSW